MSTNPSHEALSAAWAGFATDIYRACVDKASDDSPNLAFSPYSIAVACLMVAFGSKGETRQQMMQAMHCTALDSDGLEEATGGLAKTLSDAAPSSSSNPSDAAPVVLDIANRLFCQNGYHFLPDYLEKLKSKCSASVDFLDFVARAEEAREQMNAWIAETTRNRITGLFQKDSVKPETRMVLANAVYFKGSWAEKFSKDATFPETFHVAPGKEVQVPTMRQNASFPHGYFEAGKAQTLTLPYAGKHLAMLLLLPDEKDGLAQLESALAGADIMRMMTQMREEEIDVQLPRFKIEGELPLAEVLQQLGMVDMFTDKADLSGMDGSRELYVSDAKHKAFLEVDEEGSEAAAVTAMMVCMRGMVMKPEFIVNHPFVFAIVHRASGTLLFLGRMVDPSL